VWRIEEGVIESRRTMSEGRTERWERKGIRGPREMIGMVIGSGEKEEEEEEDGGWNVIFL